MSFSSEVKEELLARIPGARHCQLAEIAAILACDGMVVSATGQDIGLLLRSETALRRKFFTLLRKAFNIDTDFWQSDESGGGRVYEMLPFSEEETRRVLASTLLIQENGRLRMVEGSGHRIIQRNCCKRAFLRDAFLCIGSVSDPSKSYHLEFVCEETVLAHTLSELLHSLGVPARETARGHYTVVYIKESEAIVDLLNLMEAPVALMRMENERIVRGMRGDVNRRVNCETANITKTVDAAERQIEDIRFLMQHGGVGRLPEALQQMAEVRLAHPDASLVELGTLLDPPVGKSGVNHRLRKLSDLARQKREELFGRNENGGEIC